MTQLVLVSAADRPALLAELRRIVGFLDRSPEASLADVAHTCALSRGAERLAVVTDSVHELRARLSSVLDRLADGTVRRIRDKSGTYYFQDRLLGPGRGKLAFVYPGVMSFYPDMMRDLAIRDQAFRSAFDELEEALVGNVDFLPSNFVFPPAQYYRHDADIFSSGAYAQALVATYTACVAMTRLLRRHGIVPDGVVGFAGGDLAAMMRSGAAGEAPKRPERVQVIRDIYRIVDKAVDHAGLPKVALITVILRREESAPARLAETIAAFPPEKVALAIDLSPRQKTYVVAPELEAEVTAALAAAGLHAVKLEFDRPFHTPACEPLVPAVLKFVSGWMKTVPNVPVYSCATAEPVPTNVKAARKDTAQRWSRPVRFADTIRRMHDDGYRVFIEVGPRGLMTSAIEITLKDREHAAVAMNSIHRRGVLQEQHALAQLAALGAEMDLSVIGARQGARTLDFDAAIPSDVRRESEMPLTREFPRLRFLSDEAPLRDALAYAQPKGRGSRAQVARAAAEAARTRRQRQVDFGAMNPLVGDADTVAQTPGVAVELRKTFRISDAPFIGDFAIGTSQLSYSDPNLRGLVLLTIPVAAEIMAETAGLLAPGSVLVAIEGLDFRRSIAFEKGALTVDVRAERVASDDPSRIAVRVELRDDRPNAEFTRPMVEATFIMAGEYAVAEPVEVEPLCRPRSVHWSGRDVYPKRICAGRRLRGISFVEAWSESGVDYEVTVPSVSDSVVFTRFPVWAVNPLLLGAVVSGFALWRSHERFPGACSFPFRMRRLEFLGPIPKAGTCLKCYMRPTGVTPKSLLCDITVSDGDGIALLQISGWEELGRHVNAEYRDLIMQPATSFVTEAFSPSFLGDPATEVASSFVTDIPYRIFERDEELWLKTFSHIVLGSNERREYAAKSGSAARRTEWLFGRIAAKEAVRRFLRENYQARWSYADVELYADTMGKPHAIGKWNDDLPAKLDIAIAHTAQFVAAVAAANARVGVDVESAARDLSEEFTQGVFTDEERDLAAAVANPDQALIRFWCAKEAVSKALGTGIRYSPREMVVTDYRADAGVLTMRLGGGWETAFPRFRGRDISVTVRNLREHALAFCFMPASLFDDEQEER